jgi:hypothetical protein
VRYEHCFRLLKEKQWSIQNGTKCTIMGTPPLHLTRHSALPNQRPVTLSLRRKPAIIAESSGKPTQKRNKPHTKHLDEDAKTNVHEKLEEAESSSTRASQVSVSECPRERTVATGCALKAQVVWCAPSVNCVGYVCLFPHFALSSCHGS